MNRITLALNAAILGVTFVVALTASDVQGGPLASATRTAGQGHRSSAIQIDSSAALLRVVQTMESFYPASEANPLTSTQLQAIRDAIDAYYTAVRAGVVDLLADVDEAADLRVATVQLGRSIRADLVAALSGAFKDAGTVRNLATEIVRNCR